MTLQELRQKLEQFVDTDEDHVIRPDYAIRPEYAGVPFFDAPLVCCADAEDPLFAQFQADPTIYGPFFRRPQEWLPGAKRVIAVFFPFTKEIRDSNRGKSEQTSDLWLHARVEGQAFLMKACRQIAAWLRAEGYRTLIPAEDEAFGMTRQFEKMSEGCPGFVSNWSERHAAYVAGLGTFSLSKHLITEKGVCGRFGSIITDAPIEVTPRPYSDPFEYCILCGRCNNNCPVDALHPEQGAARGKDLLTCATYVDNTRVRFAPRYGCGKCQLDVPCETGIPRAVLGPDAKSSEG